MRKTAAARTMLAVGTCTSNTNCSTPGMPTGHSAANHHQFQFQSPQMATAVLCSRTEHRMLGTQLAPEAVRNTIEQVSRLLLLGYQNMIERFVSCTAG